MMVLFFLQPPRIFLLLFLQQLLLHLGIFPLLYLHELFSAYFFLGNFESLLVLLEEQSFLKVQLLLAVMHLRLKITANSVVVMPLENVFQWEVARGVGPIEEGRVLLFNRK